MRINDAIIEFLKDKGWEWKCDQKNDMMYCFFPPDAFGLPHHYAIIVPKYNTPVDFIPYCKGLLDIIYELYRDDHIGKRFVLQWVKELNYELKQ